MAAQRPKITPTCIVSRVAVFIAVKPCQQWRRRSGSHTGFRLDLRASWVDGSPAAVALMSLRSTVAPVTLAVGALLISMVSYQCGASLAKHLFPQVGAQGATAYRLGLSALMLLLWRRPWRRLGSQRNWRALWTFGAYPLSHLHVWLTLSNSRWCRPHLHSSPSRLGVVPVGQV